MKPFLDDGCARVVAQALPAGRLRKCHAAVPLGVGQRSAAVITLIPADTKVKKPSTAEAPSPEQTRLANVHDPLRPKDREGDQIGQYRSSRGCPGITQEPRRD